MELKVEWTIGFDPNHIFYIDKNTLVYLSGHYVCFFNEETGKSYMPLPSYATTELIVHPLDNIFALCESEKLNPSVYIYQYPSLEKIGIITNFAKSNISKFAFSNSDYLAIVSGLPDFTLSLWNFKTQTQLCSKPLDTQVIEDLSISPINWKNIVVISGYRIFMYTIEHCGSLYLMKDKYLKLPPSHTVSGSNLNAIVQDSRITVVKSSSRMISYDFELPPSAKAGVSSDNFKEFLESQDDEIRFECVSHVWSGTGDLYFGCEEGQLIKLEMSEGDLKFNVIFNPKKNTSGNLRVETPNNVWDNINLTNNIKVMCFAKEGIYMAGEDGILRIARTVDNEITDNIEEVHKISGSVSKLVFNYVYTRLAVVSQNGVIDILSVNENVDPYQSLMDVGYGAFAGICVLAGGKHVSTLRVNGNIQIWDIENQRMVSSIYLDEMASSIDASPLWSIVGVGLSNGYLEIIDVNDVTQLKEIHKIKLHNMPINKIQFSRKGQIIVTTSDDGYVTVLSGLVSDGFKVLGMIGIEGHVLDLCVFQNPTADEIAQVAISSQTNFEKKGANKLVYFEISAAILNDPSNFYENIHGIFDEDVIRKMSLIFENTTFGCVLGVQPPEERSPVLYAVDVESRTLCLFQIPSSPPKREDDMNREMMLKIIQTNHINIPGISKINVDVVSLGTTEMFMSTDGEFDKMSTRTSINEYLPRKENSRRYSGPRLSLVDNIDWKAVNKVKLKLTQFEGLSEKHQNQLKLISKIEELNKAGNKASRLRPIKSFNEFIHEDPQVSIQSSLNNRMIMTYGLEGMIRIMDTKTENIRAAVIAHQMNYNGVTSAIFNLDSNSIFSCSNDGTFSCHKILISDAFKLSNEQDYLKFVSSVDSKILHQNSELMSFSNIGKSQKVFKHSDSFTSMDNRKLSSDNIPKSEEVVCKTWSEKRVIEHQAEEDQQYEELKNSIKEGIKSMQTTIQFMVDENDNLSDLEKIDRQEFELDLEMKKKIHGDIENEIKKVVDEIEQNNLAKQYILDVILKECWDQMLVKGRSLCAFNSNTEVTNFPLKERLQPALDQIDMVIKRRMIEIEDINDRKNYCEHLYKTALNSDEAEEGEEEEVRDSSNLTSHDLKGYEQFQKIAPSVKYLYPQTELETREQKIYQVILLKDIIYQVKVQFNKEFTDVYQKKEQEISRIKEKNARIVKILNDIDMAHLIQPDPELSSLEKPEKLLVVEDHEIKVERYLTDEQRRKLEEDRLAEEERKRKEKLDNWRERGLKDMMGGVLEVKREDELKKDIPKPDFLIAGKAPEDWTDEEKKIFEEYERKVKELNDEREKYKKQLEAEYKRLSNIIDDAKASFDEALMNLFNRQISVQMSIYHEEIKILRIQWSLLVDEELTARRNEILELKKENIADINSIKNVIDDSKTILERTQDHYDTMVAEEKVMDKAFRKEFIDIHGSLFDHISKIYKRRPRNRLLGTQQIPANQMPNYSKYNPYLNTAASTKMKQFQMETLKHAIQELDKQDTSDTIDPAIYERLCKARRKRIIKEFDIKQMAFEVADMQSFHQKRLEEERSLENKELDLDNLMEMLETYRYQYHTNKELQLVVKQGQVEVDAVPGFIHDFTESVLLHRSTIEDLNKEIKQLGQNKVKHMTKSKDSRKKFIHLEWELRRMLMEYEDLIRKMREIQCFKITKEIQRYLATNDYDALINAEIQKMEQTINHLKAHQSKNLEQKKSRLKFINDSKLIKLKNENQDMSVQLTELNVQVNERKHINAGFPGDNVGQRNVELRYQKILQRQQLVDLAKCQAREVAVLRAEVERLRMRTFPALIQHSGS